MIRPEPKLTLSMKGNRKIMSLGLKEVEQKSVKLPEAKKMQQLLTSISEASNFVFIGPPSLNREPEPIKKS